jgi:hypothetical protein
MFSYKSWFDNAVTLAEHIGQWFFGYIRVFCNLIKIFTDITDLNRAKLKHLG